MTYLILEPLAAIGPQRISATVCPAVIRLSFDKAGSVCYNFAALENGIVS
jgi:hypothetical protein